jgi:Na+-transporting NADH:ubiquinone oxidoreductase subunit F
MVEKVLYIILAIAGLSGFLSIALVLAELFRACYGKSKILINNKKELSVKSSASLLSSLKSRKIFLPSACGGLGTCAYCKCRVLKGAGPLSPAEVSLLSHEEIQNSIRLSCQVKVEQNLEIEIPDALFAITEFKARVAFIKDLTYDIKLVRLNLLAPAEIDFKAGQYVQLYTHPYENIKDSVSRAYSVASPNFEKKFVELMIRLVPEGICTTWVHKYLKPGDTVKIIGPMGDFYLRDGEGDAVMIAGGSGMAPIVSMLNEVALKKINRKITYFFGAVAKRDLFYLDEIEKLKQQLANFTFVPALSQPAVDDDWHGEIGLITVPLENYLKEKDTSNMQGYLCGSPGMIDAAVAVLHKYGITDERIFFDPFA